MAGAMWTLGSFFLASHQGPHRRKHIQRSHTHFQWRGKAFPGTGLGCLLMRQRQEYVKEGRQHILQTCGWEVSLSLKNQEQIRRPVWSHIVMVSMYPPKKAHGLKVLVHREL